MPKKILLFDFDGTLADSTKHYHDFYKQLHEEEGMPLPWQDLEGFRQWVSGDWRENVQRMGLQSKLRELTEKFRAHRSANVPGLHRGIKTLLREIPPNWSAGVLSAENSDYVQRVLQNEGVVNSFERIYGPDNLSTAKPSPSALLRAIENLGGTPGQTIYVGDTEQDIGIAKNAGARSLAVSYGWHPRGRLKRLNPDYLADSPRELKEIIQGLN